MGWGRREGTGVREVVGEWGRNDPNIVCTYELKKKKRKSMTQGKKKKVARNLPSPHPRRGLLTGL
jgi:hypothetical protein